MIVIRLMMLLSDVWLTRRRFFSLIGLLNRGCRIWCDPVIRRIPVAMMHLWCRRLHLCCCHYSAAIQSLCWQLLGPNALIVHLGSLHSLRCLFSPSVSDWWSVLKPYGLPLMRFVSIHTLLAVDPVKSRFLSLVSWSLPGKRSFLSCPICGDKGEQSLCDRKVSSSLVSVNSNDQAAQQPIDPWPASINPLPSERERRLDGRLHS